VMHCLGVGSRAQEITWLGPRDTLRRSDFVACPMCGKRLAPRKDGLVRKHVAKPRSRPSLVGQLDEHLQREPVRRPTAGRVITQK